MLSRGFTLRSEHDIGYGLGEGLVQVHVGVVVQKLIHKGLASILLTSPNAERLVQLRAIISQGLYEVTKLATC